jgi:hypothetical protein
VVLSGTVAGDLERKENELCSCFRWCDFGGLLVSMMHLTTAA